VALDEVDDGWDENGGWGVTGVASSLTTLGADQVDTESEALGDVLWVADHVHVEDAVGVELVDDGLWWDTDGRDEELGARLDDNVDELVELALGVIVVGLAGVTANLWEKEIDTEWSVLIVQVRLELSNLLAEHVWGVADTTDNTETTGIGDCGSELWASGNVHSSQNNWVVDLQEIGGGGADLLWRSHDECSLRGIKKREVKRIEYIV